MNEDILILILWAVALLAGCLLSHIGDDLGAIRALAGMTLCFSGSALIKLNRLLEGKNDFSGT